MTFGSFWDDIYQVAMESPPTAPSGSSYNIAYNASSDHAEEASFMVSPVHGLRSARPPPLSWVSGSDFFANLLLISTCAGRRGTTTSSSARARAAATTRTSPPRARSTRSGVQEHERVGPVCRRERRELCRERGHDRARQPRHRVWPGGPGVVGRRDVRRCCSLLSLW